MESIALLIAAVALIAAGCGATILSVYVFPLWMRVRGQAHGRFAGLSLAGESSEQGSVRKAGGPGRAITEQPAPNLIVA
jgi:hypothetical protein